MPGRHVGEWMCSSAYSEPGHKMEMSGQLHERAALPTWKEPPK